ncbi:MAG: glycosyltransferase [Candidatus Methanoperedens sp.]
MKICYIAAHCGHTAKWLEYFVRKGHDVHLISVNRSQIKMPGVNIHYLPSFESKILRLASTFLIGGILSRKIINRIKPDVVHAFEVSEGFCGALTGFHPFVMTPQGSDLLVFSKNLLL